VLHWGWFDWSREERREGGGVRRRRRRRRRERERERRRDIFSVFQEVNILQRYVHITKVCSTKLHDTIFTKSGVDFLECLVEGSGLGFQSRIIACCLGSGGPCW
jgi:hypothetical protein